MLWTFFIAALDGDAVVVPAGTDHDLVNMSKLICPRPRC